MCIKSRECPCSQAFMIKYFKCFLFKCYLNDNLLVLFQVGMVFSCTCLSLKSLYD